MTTIISLLKIVVQILRLILSALIVFGVYMFFSDLKAVIERRIEFFLLLLPLFIFWVLAFTALNRIVTVLKHFEDGDFFAKNNAKSIAFLGYILVAYGIGKPILEFASKLMEQGQFKPSLAVELDKGFVSELAFGLVLLLAAKVIKRGTDLQEDQHLTI